MTTADLARAIDGRSVGVVFIALEPDYDMDPLSLAAGTLPFRIGSGEPPSRLVDALNLTSSPWCGGFTLDIPVAPDGLTFDLDGIRTGIRTQMGDEFFPRVSGPDACNGSVNGGFY